MSEKDKHDTNKFDCKWGRKLDSKRKETETIHLYKIVYILNFELYEWFYLF